MTTPFDIVPPPCSPDKVRVLRDAIFGQESHLHKKAMELRNLLDKAAATDPIQPF
jgi:hypothetical protein